MNVMSDYRDRLTDPGDGRVAHAPRLDGRIASGPSYAERDAKPMDGQIVLSPDFRLVDLVGAVESMSAGGSAEAGLTLYEMWLRHHQTDPLRYVAYFNYGTLLSQVMRPEQSATAFAEAIRLQPSFLPAYVNAGLMLERLGRLDEAVGYWTCAATSVQSDHYLVSKKEALKHLSRLFKYIGEIARAEAALGHCLDIDPSQRDVIQHWTALREMQCKWPVIEPWGRLTTADLMAALSPLAAAIHTNDPMFQLARANRCYQQDILRTPLSGPVCRWNPADRQPTSNGRLRIGYVSPDLREHAIGFLTVELFELHDRANVEVFAYYSGRVRSDALQERVKRTVDHWCDIYGWDNAKAARRIIDDKIDILVDLGGHTGETPAILFALRPAPVIVNWLGYPGSMGTPHHNYIISDETIIPPRYEKYYSERVMRLPCYQPTDRKRISASPLSRQDVGLGEDAFVYCCFNGTQKITEATFQCWMLIQARVPDAVLWLLSCDLPTDQRLRRRAADFGISPDRLIFAARKPNAEHLMRYPLADLFLDTSPYGAHTTASDTLWMGVPVLTIAGHSFASRVCASLVRSAGLPELVCGDLKTYAEIAVELGTNSVLLRSLRGKLQAGRDRCTLFNMPLLTQRLEALYREMWDEFMSGRLPEPDLTNLPIYDDIGAGLDHETIEVRDLDAYEQAYKAKLADRNRLMPIPPDRRLWTAPFFR